MTTKIEHLAILLNSTTADRPEICVTPLVHALAARALDCEVEIHFAGPAIRLLVEGVAEALYPTPQKEKSVLSFIQEASNASVTLLACSMARAAWVAEGEGLIAECNGSAGATSFVVRALDPEWKTLVF